MMPYRRSRPMAVPKTLEARLEIAKAIRALMTPPSAHVSMGKFDPDQPRVPAGNPDGGQWTSGGGPGRAVSADRPFALAARSKQSEAECMAQYANDSFICRAVRTRVCWQQAAERLSACLSGRPLPSLNF